MPSDSMKIEDLMWEHVEYPEQTWDISEGVREAHNAQIDVAYWLGRFNPVDVRTASSSGTTMTIGEATK